MKDTRHNESSKYKLQPNTPATFPEYEPYAEHIYNGILTPGVFNIALFGSYATGKSSIIETFKGKYNHDVKIKEISFVNFRTIEADKNENKSGTSNGTKSEQDISVSARTILQKEIVRQFYFGEKPGKLKFSKFSRINPGTYYAVETLTASLVALMAVSRFITFLENTPWWFCAASCLIISLISVIAGSLTGGLASKMRIKALGFSGISAELSDEIPDFEQMTDEIIYFFKATGYQVVIFEDLDRLGDEQIYEDLRQLNYLVNESKSVKQKVVFIYALGDSLIKDGSNRAKLFDMPIHAVPFLSPFGAFDELKKVMSKTGIDCKPFDDELLKIIAKKLPDRRRIVSFANMLAVYLEKMGRSKLKLDKNKIAAIVLLRELNPEEYGKMLDGNGSVDAAYNDGIEKGENELREIAKNISSRRSAERKIAENASSTWKYVQARIKNGYARTLKRDDGTEIKEKDFADINLWKDIATGRDHITVHGYPRNEILDLSKPENGNKVSEQISELLSILKHNNGYYLGKYNNAKAKRALSTDSKDTEEFKELIEHRYLDDDYSLYLAPYNGDEQDEQIVNFEQGVFRRNAFNPSIELNKDQWQKVISKLGEYDYANRAFLNYSFYDYLLANHLESTNEIIKQMLNVSKEEFLVFYSGYVDHCMVNGKTRKNADDITDILAEMRPGVLCKYYVDGLLQRGEEYDSLKIKIFNILEANDELLENGDLEYIMNSLHLLPKEIIDGRILAIIQRYGDIKIKSLVEYEERPALQRLLAEAKLYAINRDNISVIRELVEQGAVELSDMDVRELLDSCKSGDFEWHDMVSIIAHCKGDKKAVKELLALAPEPYKKLSDSIQAVFKRTEIAKGTLQALQKKDIAGKIIESSNGIRVYLKKK